MAECTGHTHARRYTHTHTHVRAHTHAYAHAEGLAALTGGGKRSRTLLIHLCLGESEEEVK